jgi:hypothetical protein
VISSFPQRHDWYDRCNFAGSMINCVLINYPAAEKRDWDGIVTRISNTLAKGRRAPHKIRTPPEQTRTREIAEAMVSLEARLALPSQIRSVPKDTAYHATDD